MESRSQRTDGEHTASSSQNSLNGDLTTSSFQNSVIGSQVASSSQNSMTGGSNSKVSVTKCKHRDYTLEKKLEIVAELGR